MRSSRVGRVVISTLLCGLATFVLSTAGWLAFWTMGPSLVGWKSVAITSGSMSPKVAVGDAVIVKPGHEDLAPGRLVTFQDPARANRMLTHRLVRQNDDGTWVTKGDANQSADTTDVPLSDIVGTGQIVVPYAGFPTVWHAKENYAPLGALAGIILVAVVSWMIGNHMEREFDDEDSAENPADQPEVANVRAAVSAGSATSAREPETDPTAARGDPSINGNGNNDGDVDGDVDGWAAPWDPRLTTSSDAGERTAPEAATSSS